MLTSVAYRPGRVPATQQQFSPVCLPHTIFTAYAKRPWGGTGTSANFSRSGCVSRSALERVRFLAISTSAKGLWGDLRHAEGLKEGNLCFFVFCFRYLESGAPLYPAVGG